MRVYKYKKPVKLNRNRVVLKSYSQSLGKLGSTIFSKPVFIVSTSMLCLMSNFFLVSSLSQVSKADNQENFKVYPGDLEKTKVSNVSYEVNPELIRAMQFTTYQVQKGDTLTAISKITKNTVEEMISNNNDLIDRKSVV